MPPDDSMTLRMSCVGGIGPRGRNGTLMPTTPATRSGWSSACCQTTMEPQSWPTKIACSAVRTEADAQARYGGLPKVLAQVGACQRAECVHNDHLMCKAAEVHVGPGRDNADCLTYAHT